MTSICYGFMSKSSFINNNTGIVSDFFELSPLALTYSKHRQEYQQDGYLGDTLHVFMNQVDDNTPNATVALPLLAQIFQISANVYGYFRDNHGNTSIAVIRNFIQSLLQDSIVGFEVGGIKETASFSMPDWVSWRVNNVEQTEVRIWFNNTAFENQYPVSSITVIPYVEDIDVFQNNYGNVIQYLQTLSITRFSETVELSRDDTPSSYTRYLEFNFYNRDNPEQYTKVLWAVLIYGREGDNIDSIKDAIAEYIESKTSYDISRWEVVFPDIFRRTEFMYFPRWDKISVENISNLASLYQSVQKVNENLTFVKTNHPETDLTLNHIADRLEIIPFAYKTLAAAVISGKSNTELNKYLTQILPDYLPLPTTSPDFNRMGIATRNWVLSMVGALTVAETATDFSTIQDPYRRVRRNQRLFIGFVYNGINHLVAARSNSFYQG